MGDEELKKIVESNAKAIQALTEELKTQAREAQLDRARLYQTMADLARAQGSYYERLESQDELIHTLSRRQGEIVEILKLLAQKKETDAP